MPTDYKTHGHRPEKKPLPGFVWLLIGLSIGLFVALIVYLDKQPENKISFDQAIKRDLEKLKHDKPEQSTATTKADEADTSNKLKYTYHTILKELEVLIPVEELKLGGDDTTKPNTPVIEEGKHYLLQAGSFKQQQDAERLKARLALLGMQANIESVSIKKDRWYRVRLGPYQRSSDAFRELKLLKTNGITAMAFTLKATP